MSPVWLAALPKPGTASGPGATWAALRAAWRLSQGRPATCSFSPWTKRNAKGNKPSFLMAPSILTHIQTWMWLINLNSWGCTGFGPCFHLPGFHLGTGFLSHSHLSNAHLSTQRSQACGHTDTAQGCFRSRVLSQSEGSGVAIAVALPRPGKDGRRYI